MELGSLIELPSRITSVESLNKAGLSRMGATALGLFTILGFSFWFFVGFPFANHNESYLWLVDLNSWGFLDALSTRMQHVATYRPLGQAVAWLGYTLSGGSIYPVEVFNYFLAVVSWLILLLAIEEKGMFSLTSLVTGGVFFSGYIYLFHLHGVFYSPLLFFTAISLLLYRRRLTVIRLVFEFSLSVLLALFHPFALLVFIASVLGLFIEKGRSFTKKQLVVLATLLVLATALAKLLSGNSASPLSVQNVLGLLASYKMLEVNPLVSIVALFLSYIALAGIGGASLRRKALLIVFMSLPAVFFFLNGLPMVIIWIAACQLKMIWMRKWVIASLVGVTFLFPIFTATGSPTYAISVLMVCTAATSIGWSIIEPKTHWVANHLAFPASIAAALIVISLRQDIHVPGFSALSNPVLAEAEKTFQLETVVNWIVKSEYRDYDLRLCQSALSPLESSNAVKRLYRAPTNASFLKVYLDSLRGKENEVIGEAMVCFGGEVIEKAVPVHAVPGKRAGNATVYVLTE